MFQSTIAAIPLAFQSWHHTSKEIFNLFIDVELFVYSLFSKEQIIHFLRQKTYLFLKNSSLLMEELNSTTYLQEDFKRINFLDRNFHCGFDYFWKNFFD